jgi:hypothetical protein
MCINTMEHYLAFKKMEILTFAATWKNLEDTILNEKSRVQNDKSHVISHAELKKSQTHSSRE